MPKKLTPTLHCTAMHILPVSLLLLSHVELAVGPHQQQHTSDFLCRVHVFLSSWFHNPVPSVHHFPVPLCLSRVVKCSLHFVCCIKPHKGLCAQQWMLLLPINRFFITREVNNTHK